MFGIARSVGVFCAGAALFFCVPRAILAAAASQQRPEAALPRVIAWSNTSSSGFWIKRYPIRSYGAHWHLDLKVRDFKKARKKIIRMFDRAGAQSRLPLESTSERPDFKYQQFSFVISRAKARKALKKLRRMGIVERSTQKDSPLADPTDEITVKLERLRAEREAGGVILERLRAVKALTDELISHLEASRESFQKSRDAVLFNIVLEEKAK